MDIIKKINQVLENYEEFTHLIEEELKTDPDVLRNFFISATGKPQTVLDYLIERHSEELNLQKQIQWLLEKEVDLNLNQPVHLALKLKKKDIAALLLHSRAENKEEGNATLNLNARDVEGKSLVYRLIYVAEIELLARCIKLGMNVNQPSPIKPEMDAPQIQPLHQAIISNFIGGVAQLIQAGAQLDNLYYPSKENSLLLAARKGHIEIIEIILNNLQQFKSEEEKRQFLNSKNSSGQTAIDVLCLQLRDKKTSKQAIRGIAMLLCHGVEAPDNPSLSSLLMGYRKELFKEIKSYSQKSPSYAASFLRRCHNKLDPLHSIMYAKNSWEQSFKQLFGIADDLAFEMETLVPPRPALKQEDAELAVIKGEAEEQFEENELLFAEFLKRYQDALKSVTFFNRWSGMLHNVSQGQVTNWESVKAYADLNPKSRTARIVHEMTSSTEIHLDFHK
ncbi:Dot/Icm T4SS effector AnkC/LegA12 [Legionella jordanis]|uniref:Ankyrin repeat protein n=1 Tax=Legionella jordanis TaxID=456 RepID=A0A0W0VB90_9GAMM|nr:Dot/Icm T4SS effector AnkC/LegA12 [Legionella jordanis]KTD17352.1 ankyrin repeat protein [Legionella jordanis]RMX01880.1 hypothetical protein EAW55_10275 [Legionella jordanis]RMX17670.1 hypothetical protein EAS68_10290 [Legionella jordanis]VEH11631.1 ankyrin repeat protein [Legionella jordanis]HAT8712991.1 hypothetical protein [Legionella jordanis]